MHAHRGVACTAARRACRDTYREQLAEEGMHGDVVRTFVDALVRILAPIAPHWADHIFRSILRAGDSVLKAGWPKLPAPDFSLRKAAEYVGKTVERVRAAITKKEAPPKKKKRTALRYTCLYRSLCVKICLLLFQSVLIPSLGASQSSSHCHRA